MFKYLQDALLSGMNFGHEIITAEERKAEKYTLDHGYYQIIMPTLVGFKGSKFLSRDIFSRVALRKRRFLAPNQTYNPFVGDSRTRVVLTITIQISNAEEASPEI